MERTAEEFLHQTRGMFGGVKGAWFIGDQMDMTRGDGYRFMLTDGRLMTERQIETAPRQRAPRFYRQKRSAKRAAQSCMSGPKAVAVSMIVDAMADVVTIAFPPDGVRGLPDVLAMDAIRKRLQEFKRA